MVQIAAHTDLINRINATSTPDQLAAILATITYLDRPGFPDDLADGHYLDGCFIGTMEGGQLAVTQVHHLAPHVLTIWGEMETRQRADQADQAADLVATVDETRRGRPEIGPRVPIRMPDWLLRRVDEYADRHGVTRAEAGRALIAAGLRATADTITPREKELLVADLFGRWWDDYRARAGRLAILDEAGRWWRLSLRRPEVTVPIAVGWTRLGYTAETAEPLIAAGTTPTDMRRQAFRDARAARDDSHNFVI